MIFSYEVNGSPVAFPGGTIRFEGILGGIEGGTLTENDFLFDS